MTSHTYLFPPTLKGILRKRYKRFLADIELESGDIVTAHCPNTGPMTGVCDIGAPVLLSQSDNPKRKLKYTWEAIAIGNTWVGVNTAAPNRIVQQGLEESWFSQLNGFAKLRREAPYGSQKSKIDFLLTYPDDSLAYVEVKNTTWCRGKRALFPDTVTTRGQKHLQELMEMVERGHRAAMLYFIHRGDCDEFAPGDDKDPEYGQLLRQAVKAGVEILPYRFAVSPEGVQCVGQAQWIL
ncbi:DNA/RNA nuclease SfsA [Synechococcus sp. PCC 7336]|uniref:DNA/RNA nuclease SfsA n=1 Tax=Synechococcus sp. PCC 7336 TaxID=195250 RepID=UPI00034B7DC9|nr:DNA/RNA nuclease SfsA [Synechococcus sp. PCC 7336]